MAYSNVSFPSVPYGNIQGYPYCAVMLSYDPLAEDWWKARLIASPSEFYYDIESHVLVAGDVRISEMSFGETSWARWWTSDWHNLKAGFGGDPYMYEDGSLSVSQSYYRIWTNVNVYDTNGNLWLAADDVTPVYQLDGATISPVDVPMNSKQQVKIKAGAADEIQFKLTRYGEVLNNARYHWLVRLLDDGKYVYTEAMSINNNGLLSITENVKSGEYYEVFAVDDVLEKTVAHVLIGVICLKSFLIGYALGLSGKPLPLSGGEPSVEPVAYLYNGVRLPKLPEWDKETYPYALITYNTAGFYVIYCFSCEPAVASKVNSTLVPLDGSGEYINLVSFGKKEDAKFGNPVTFTALLGSVTTGTIWTNFDLLYRDTGSVYLAASEPIPVYE